MGLLPEVEKRLPHWWHLTRPGTLRAGAGGGPEGAEGGSVGPGELTRDLSMGGELQTLISEHPPTQWNLRGGR